MWVQMILLIILNLILNLMFKAFQLNERSKGNFKIVQLEEDIEPTNVWQVVLSCKSFMNKTKKSHVPL